MQQNTVILIGYTGKKATVRTDKNERKYTMFTMATTTRYKVKATREFKEHTEWHRCIVFGPRAEQYAELPKGAHVLVEGSIRHSEYKGVQTDSILAKSILKLDRAEKPAPDEEEPADIPAEEEAA